MAKRRRGCKLNTHQIVYHQVRRTGRSLIGSDRPSCPHDRSYRARALALNFLETNVRTYVLYNDRPGVYFFSLDASSRIAVLAARAGWGLPYYYAKMEMTRAGDEIQYALRRSDGTQHQVRYRLGHELRPSQPETIEHFLLERYLLFVERNGRLLTGQVHHVAYPVQQASVLAVEDGLVAAAGLPAVDTHPAHVHYSPGVDVEVLGLG